MFLLSPACCWLSLPTRSHCRLIDMCWCLGFIPSYVQTFSFPFVNLDEVSVISVLQLTEVLLDVCMTTWSTRHSSLFWIVGLSKYWLKWTKTMPENELKVKQLAWSDSYVLNLLSSHPCLTYWYWCQLKHVYSKNFLKPTYICMEYKYIFLLVKRILNVFFSLPRLSQLPRFFFWLFVTKKHCSTVWPVCDSHRHGWHQEKQNQKTVMIVQPTGK